MATEAETEELPRSRKKVRQTPENRVSGFEHAEKKR
jgi:hypothetical protein